MLASLAAAAVHQLTGTTSEVGLRLVFLAAGVATVGLLAYALARRYGRLATAAGLAVLVANPLVFGAVRQVRGYAFLLLFTVAATIVVFSMLATPKPSRWTVVLYAALLALGIGSHLYMFGVLAVHVAIVAARRRVSVVYLVAWASAAVGGLAINAVAIYRGLRWSSARQFSPRFPLELAGDLTGRSPVAVVAVVVLVALGVPWLWPRRDVRWAAFATAALAAVLWLVVRPEFLYARFFVWLLPAVALAVAAGVARGRAIGVPAVVLAGLCVVAVGAEAASWATVATADTFANRRARDVIEPLERAGLRPCVQAQSRDVLLAYASPPVVADARELAGCDAVVVLTEEMAGLPASVNDPAQVAAVAHAFPDRRRLAAVTPGWIYFDQHTVCGSAAARPLLCDQPGR